MAKLHYHEPQQLETAVKMTDDSYAWLSASGRYYVRRERHSTTRSGRKRVWVASDEWTHIAYYDKKTRERIPLARAECEACHDVIESKHGGDFVSCACGETYVDTDRWMPERHRYGGKARPVQ